MEIRNDYIIRIVVMLVEMLRKMVGKGSIESSVLDQILNEACGIDLEPFQDSPELIKHLIAMSSANDENKKALAIVALYLKDDRRFGKLCQEILATMRWNLLHSETQKLLKQTFNSGETS